MSAMSARFNLTLVVALGVTGCGATSSYQPANSPRVSVAQDGIYKNGKKYTRLTDAVADNPRALEEARTAQSAQQTGSLLILGGTVLWVGGFATLISNQGETTAVTGLSLMGASVIATILGAIVWGNGNPHAKDAVNIYNDDVEAKMCIKRLAPAPVPTGTPATPTPEPR